jgi:hypothetical protein
MISAQLLLLGLGMNLAFLFVSAWLPDAGAQARLPGVDLAVGLVVVRAVYRNELVLPSVPMMTAMLLVALVFVSSCAPGCRMRPQGQLTACRSNLRNIGLALEEYACDHGGVYPQTLLQLTPQYLTSVPTCPAAGKDTYSRKFVSSSSGWTLMCAGCHHHGAGIDAPDSINVCRSSLTN